MRKIIAWSICAMVSLVALCAGSANSDEERETSLIITNYGSPISTDRFAFYDFVDRPVVGMCPYGIGGIPEVLRFPLSSFEYGEAQVIADVMAINLVAVNRLDGNRVGSFYHDGAAGWYRVEFKTRKVIAGKFKERWFSTVVRYGACQNLDWGSWMFFRGVTLRLRLRREHGKWILEQGVPVLPYEPFDSGVRAYFHEYSLKYEKTFAPDPSTRVEVTEENQSEPIFALKYGEHTFVRFPKGKVVAKIAMKPEVDFYDFGETGTIKVWFKGSEANRDYWKYAWFADAPIGCPPRVELHEFNPTNRVDGIKAE